MFKVFKPKGTLKDDDQYKTKIKLASETVNSQASLSIHHIHSGIIVADGKMC